MLALAHFDAGSLRMYPFRSWHWHMDSVAHPIRLLRRDRATGVTGTCFAGSHWCRDRAGTWAPWAKDSSAHWQAFFFGAFACANFSSRTRIHWRLAIPSDSYKLQLVFPTRIQFDRRLAASVEISAWRRSHAGGVVGLLLLSTKTLVLSVAPSDP